MVAEAVALAARQTALTESDAADATETQVATTAAALRAVATRTAVQVAKVAADTAEAAAGAQEFDTSDLVD